MFAKAKLLYKSDVGKTLGRVGKYTNKNVISLFLDDMQTTSEKKNSCF